MFDVQKASMWKRISAALFDSILIAIVAVGAVLLLSSLFGYDAYAQQLEQAYASYEEQYDVKLSITAEQYAELTEAERQRYDEALQAFAADAEINRIYGLMFHYTVLMLVFGVLASFLILEFLIPLLLGNGQTLGKKIFGIGVMRVDGVKLSPLLLFARAVLGKYTVETMLPILIIVMIYFNVMGIVGVILIGALAVFQLVLLVSSPLRTPIHDRLAQTVAVDFEAQLIFDSDEALRAYQKEYNESKE